MNESNKNNPLSSKILNPERINFILLEPSNNIDSLISGNNLRGEAVRIFNKDITETLLLPLMKSD